MMQRKTSLVSLHVCTALFAIFVCLVLLGCSSESPESAESNEAEIEFSLDSGVYSDESISVMLSAPSGCTIAYTTDGSAPTEKDSCGASKVELSLDRSLTGNLVAHRNLMQVPEDAEEAILEDSTLPFGVVLNACVIDDQGKLSNPVTKTYFLGDDFDYSFPNCLVVSLVTDPENLLNYETGILATGAVYDEWKESPEGQSIIENQETWLYETNSTQRGKDWERPCLLQIFDSQNNLVVEQASGMRVTGGTSSRESQKSFNIYFREEYGSKFLDYELFTGLNTCKGFRLRAGGNNTRMLKFKDAFLMDLLSDRNFLMAQSRTAVLFLNGEYWGPYILSEKISDQMIHDHFGVDKEQVIIMKEGKVEEGADEDIALYEELMSYAQKDLADPKTWREFCGVMDIESMADFCAARVYIGDADWRPDQNDILWRTRDDSFNNGRWQYILYDVEYSSGTYGRPVTAPETDHLHLDMDEYPLFAQAMRNSEFYSLFLESLKEIGSENCNAERVRSIMQAYLEIWEPLLPDYYKRYGDWHLLWDEALNQTTEFFDRRYNIIIPIA